jgi:hypothetical protein
MSSFFSMAPDGSGLQVSSKFWIFWAFAIPITLLVMAIFTLWIQRREISAVMQPWAKRKPVNQEFNAERGQAEKTVVSGKS